MKVVSKEVEFLMPSPSSTQSFDDFKSSPGLKSSLREGIEPVVQSGLKKGRSLSPVEVKFGRFMEGIT